jgi:hypothetical protein
MQVSITRTLELPETVPRINELEAAIWAFGRALMQQLMAQAWQQYQQRHWQCEVCESSRLTGEGYKSFTLFTLFGRVPLKRYKVYCHSCGHYCQPLDGRLKELAGGHATVAFREVACLAGAAWPYGSAAHVLERISGSRISPEQVRRLAGKEGEKVAEIALKEAQEVLQGRSPQPLAAPEGVNIELDGGWVGSLEKQEGMEGKVGVVFQSREQVGKERWELKGRRLAATFQSSEVLGKLCYKEAFALGVERAGRQAVIGDGASWINSVAQEHFPAARRILDLWHLEKRLSEALASVVAEAEERAVSREKVREYLRLGRVEEALRELRALAETSSSKKLEEFVGYGKNNILWIGCYEELKAQGYPVGSGAIEKGVDLVINRRFKGRRGMRWKRANADRIVALRVLELNGDWDAYWRACKAA